VRTALLSIGSKQILHSTTFYNRLKTHNSGTTHTHTHTVNMTNISTTRPVKYHPLAFDKCMITAQYLKPWLSQLDHQFADKTAQNYMHISSYSCTHSKLSLSGLTIIITWQRHHFNTITSLSQRTKNVHYPTQ